MKTVLKITLLFASISMILLGIGFSNSFAVDLEFGEYESLGNTWVEVTHSAANPPIWSVWSGTYLKQNYPDEWKNISSELELAQKFFQQYDIAIIDLVESSKNSQVCEALGCIFGTYHLLISEIDYQKFKNQGFESGREGWITSRVAGNFYDSNEGLSYQEFIIPNRIVNGEIENLEILEGNVFSLKITSQSDSVIEINLPISISESRTPIGDNNFLILIDGEESKNYIETREDCFYNLTIPLPDGTNFVEIFSDMGDPRIPLEIMSEPSPDCKRMIMVQEIQPPKEQAAIKKEQSLEEYEFLEKNLTTEIAKKIKWIQFEESFALPLTIIIVASAISLTILFIKRRKNKITL